MRDQCDMFIVLKGGVKFLGKYLERGHKKELIQNEGGCLAKKIVEKIGKKASYQIKYKGQNPKDKMRDFILPFRNESPLLCSSSSDKFSIT